MEHLVFTHNFGEETFGKIVYDTTTRTYQCYETPRYGGDYNKVGPTFTDLETAKFFLLGMA